MDIRAPDQQYNPYRIFSREQWAWLRDDTPDAEQSRRYFVLCVDSRSAYRFQQRYLERVTPIRFRGFDTVLGLCNPGTTQRGFKACVTADYDLFASWPSKADQMGNQHALMGQIAKLRPAGAEVDSGVSRAANLTPSAAIAVANGKEVGRVSGAANRELRLRVPNAHRWSPDDPFLYDLHVVLRDATGAVDSVTSYFAMRSVGAS